DQCLDIKVQPDYSQEILTQSDKQNSPPLSEQTIINTPQQAIDLIAKNYPKLIEARGDFAVPADRIHETSMGWKIDFFWGLCEKCHCIFEVKKDGSVKLLEKGEEPAVCEEELKATDTKPNHEVIMQSDKSEYQSAGTIKVTIYNNLEQILTAPVTMFGEGISYEEKINGKWKTTEFIAYSLKGFIACLEDILPDSVCAFELEAPFVPGIYRLESVLWTRGENRDASVYSNEFEIKEKVSQPENYCEKDSDCVFKGGCYCGCYNKDYKNEKLESMFCSCEIEPPGKFPDCLCENNKCPD
ncbi:MAG: hypothetical protein ABH896_04575, partial [Candidatus Jacksonbacteria bacterium]